MGKKTYLIKFVDLCIGDERVFLLCLYVAEVILCRFLKRDSINLLKIAKVINSQIIYSVHQHSDPNVEKNAS